MAWLSYDSLVRPLLASSIVGSMYAAAATLGSGQAPFWAASLSLYRKWNLGYALNILIKWKSITPISVSTGRGRSVEIATASNKMESYNNTMHSNKSETLCNWNWARSGSIIIKHAKHNEVEIWNLKKKIYIYMHTGARESQTSGRMYKECLNRYV